MAETTAPELLAGPLVDPIVLTQHEPAGEGLLIRIEARGNGLLCPPPCSVEEPIEPGAAARQGADLARLKLHGNPEPPTLGSAPLLGLGQPPARFEAIADAELRRAASPRGGARLPGGAST
jgi:hypothetical protein